MAPVLRASAVRRRHFDTLSAPTITVTTVGSISSEDVEARQRNDGVGHVRNRPSGEVRKNPALFTATCMFQPYCRMEEGRRRGQAQD